MCGVLGVRLQCALSIISTSLSIIPVNTITQEVKLHEYHKKTESGVLIFDYEQREKHNYRDRAAEEKKNN